MVDIVDETFVEVCRTPRSDAPSVRSDFDRISAGLRGHTLRDTVVVDYFTCEGIVDDVEVPRSMLPMLFGAFTPSHMAGTAAVRPILCFPSPRSSTGLPLGFLALEMEPGDSNGDTSPESPAGRSDD